MTTGTSERTTSQKSKGSTANGGRVRADSKQIFNLLHFNKFLYTCLDISAREWGRSIAIFISKYFIVFSMPLCLCKLNLHEQKSPSYWTWLYFLLQNMNPSSKKFGGGDAWRLLLRAKSSKHFFCAVRWNKGTKLKTRPNIRNSVCVRQPRFNVIARFEGESQAVATTYALSKYREFLLQEWGARTMSGLSGKRTERPRIFTSGSNVSAINKP